MKILITGANGYIGSKIVKKLCDKGISVIATDINDTYIDSRAKFIKADIFSVNKNWMDFFDNPDICLHMAWRNGFVHNSVSHLNDLHLHYAFLTNLIDNGLKKVCIMGTMHEIGYFEGSIDENTPCNPQSLYGISKNALRNSIENYILNKNCLFQWIRGFYIYGDDTYGNSIFCKIRQAEMNGEKKFPFTSGTNQCDFIHIDELTTQIVTTILQNEYLGIINCCSGKPKTLSEQVEDYISHNKLSIKLDYGKYPDRPYDSPCIYGNVDKINNIMKKNLKILVTGVNGQLGYDCIRELKSRGYQNIIGVDIKDLDITDEKSVYKFIEDQKPDIVMHNAAWTAVDKAEEFKEKVFEVNSLGPKYIATACKKIDAKMVYISTDYVFDGKGEKPFETNDPKSGLSIYGQSKLEGENAIIQNMDKYFIVRTSWVFGFNGNNFVKTMLKLADSGKTQISVVDDQIGSVTYTRDLAVLLCDMIETNKYGVYHATNEGFISWADFAKEIFKLTKKNVVVNAVSTAEYKKLVPNQADRPLNSRLSKMSLINSGFDLMPNWRNALIRFLIELGYNI